MKGLEPPRLSTPEPKSGAATNYATSAFTILKHTVGFEPLIGNSDQSVCDSPTTAGNVLQYGAPPQNRTASLGLQNRCFTTKLAGLLNFKELLRC